MDARSFPTAGSVEELDEATCWTLLGAEGIGRIAWTGADGPVVLPLNYRIGDHRIELRTAAYSALAREVEDSIVAFEVDRIDEVQHTGWSVLAQGRASFDFESPAGTGPVPWAAGSRALRISITPRSVSGRRLH